jgi:hypothetical protein
MLSSSHERLETLSESILDISIIKDFIDNSSMWDKFDKIVNNCKRLHTCNNEESKFCTSALVSRTPGSNPSPKPRV